MTFIPGYETSTKKMKYLFSIPLLLLLFTTCKKKDDFNPFNPSTPTPDPPAASRPGSIGIIGDTSDIQTTTKGGLVIMGDTSPILIKQNRTTWIVLGIATLLGLIAGAYFFYSKKKRSIATCEPWMRWRGLERSWPSSITRSTPGGMT